MDDDFDGLSHEDIADRLERENEKLTALLGAAEAMVVAHARAMRKAEELMRDVVESYERWNKDPGDCEPPGDAVGEIKKFLIAVDAVLPPNQ